MFLLLGFVLWIPVAAVLRAAGWARVDYVALSAIAAATVAVAFVLALYAPAGKDRQRVELGMGTGAAVQEGAAERTSDGPHSGYPASVRFNLSDVCDKRVQAAYDALKQMSLMSSLRGWAAGVSAKPNRVAILARGKDLVLAAGITVNHVRLSGHSLLEGFHFPAFSNAHSLAQTAGSQPKGAYFAW